MSNNYKKRLDRAAESPVVVYHKFLLNFKSSNDFLHAFFEGKEDITYYRPCLTHFLDDPAGFYPYNCGNKRAVIAVRDMIFSRSGRKGFFVDRDLDLYINGKEIDYAGVYVTDGYSFESEFNGANKIIAVVESIYQCALPDDIRNRIESLYVSAYERFDRISRYISCWWLFNHFSGRRVNINNLNSSMLYEFDNGLGFRLRYTDARIVEFLDRQCGVETPWVWFLVESDVRSFFSAIPSYNFSRGKFVFKFFYDFFVALTDVLRSEGRLGCVYGQGINEFRVAASQVIGYPNGLKDYARAITA